MQDEKIIVPQSEFSALVRENELKLLGGTFQVENMEEESSLVTSKVDDTATTIEEGLASS